MKQVALLIALLGAGILFAQTAIAPEFGDGTEENPYQIASLENLFWISDNMEQWDKHFIQTADIDATETENWFYGYGWKPIGREYWYNEHHSEIFPFEGVYNGNGFAIEHLFMSGGPAGLFGYTENAVIEGVTITNLNYVDFLSEAGGIVTYLYQSELKNCYTSGTITINGSIAGGLVGKSESSTIIDSYSSCNINGITAIGGIVGLLLDSEIQNSFYNYEEVLINNHHVITIGALDNEMFNLWLDNEQSLSIDDFLTYDGENYLINSPDDFRKLLYFGQFPDYSYLLNTNIDLSDLIEFNEFYIPYFTGYFDGNQFEISNLNNILTTYVLPLNQFGLFGVLRNATVQNLDITDTMIQSQGVEEYVGALSGYASNSTISNCSSAGSVTGNKKVGGLVGEANYATVANSFSSCYVSGCTTGGLIGVAVESNIQDCYSSGNVHGTIYVGGLVGYSINSNFYYCYNSGDVNGTSEVGGLAGIAFKPNSIQNSYSTGNISGNSNVGGIIGSAGGTDLPNSYYNYEQVLINDEHVITVGALDNELYTIWQNNGYSLNIDDFLEFNGQYYQINNVVDFKKILAFGQYQDYQYLLTDTIDLIEETNFFIPYLRGNFNGNGFTIKNISLTLPDFDNLGLFGYAYNSIIENVGVVNFSAIGRQNVGSIVGRASSNTQIRNCFGSGNVEADYGVGGLVGRFWSGSLSYCYSTTSVISDNSGGGLIGNISSANVHYSYWNIETSGQTTSEGGEGRTTAEMTFPYAENTYVNWDFSEIWSADEDYSVNNGYPYLIQNQVSTEENNLPQVNSITITNYPNPFNPSTTIQFSSEVLAKDEPVTIEIYNIKGQRVKQFQVKNVKSKMNEVVWDGKDNENRPVSSGVYLYQIKSEAGILGSKKMLLMK